MRTLLAFLTSALSVALLATAAELSNLDRIFIQKALQSGGAEVRRAAVEADSSDYRVRQYAGKITTDHQISNQQLMAIASKFGVDMEGAPPQPPLQTTPNPLGRPNAPASHAKPMPAKQYFQTEVEAHRQAIALYEHEASSGNPQLRQYAKQTLPVLQKHLQMAETYLKQEH
jgi:putative membrane protein